MKGAEPHLSGTRITFLGERRSVTLCIDDGTCAMTGRYLMKARPQVQEFFNEIAADMALSFSIPFAEAVARINQRWRDQTFLHDHDLIFHEYAHYWAMNIYFIEVPDWNPEADRSQWQVRSKPESDSEFWTIAEA